MKAERKQRFDQGTAFWRSVAATLTGVVVSGVSAWLVFGQGAVGRDEVSRMIVEGSPYVADRRLIAETLADNSRLLEKVAADVVQIKVEQVRLAERIEILMSRQGLK